MTHTPRPHPGNPSPYLHSARQPRAGSYPGHPYPPSPAGLGPPPNPPPNPPPRNSKGKLAIVGAVLALGLSVGGFLGVRTLTGAEAGGSSEDGSGEVFSPPDKPYSVEIPQGVVEVSPRKDSSIPSETDLSLALPGKIGAGGLIKTGTLSGPAAHGTFDEIGQEAANGYSSEYEGHPDVWGSGAKVEQQTTQLDGRDAVEIAAQYSPDADPTPSVFFRIYVVDPPSGPAILITCDWNTHSTQDIQAACDTLVASFTITKNPS